jgi:antitoxin component HigA of HigAB toxin-antitoxin module
MTVPCLRHCRRMDQVSAFPDQQIVEFLVNNLDHQVTIQVRRLVAPVAHSSAQELKNPTAALVQTVYFRMLTVFSFADSMLQPSLELMNTLDHPEVLKDMIPTLSLQAGLVDLISSLVGKNDFGIMDLLRPTAKRTAKFISVLQNFWLFCNQRHQEADQALKEVEGLVEKKIECDNLIENFKNEINRRLRKAVEDEATEDALNKEIEGLRVDLESWGPRREELDREKVQLDGELGRLHAETEKVEARKRKLQAEIAALQGVFEGAATMEKLDQEIGQLVEDLQYLEQNKLKLRNNMEALERTRVEYVAVLELVRQSPGRSRGRGRSRARYGSSRAS